MRNAPAHTWVFTLVLGAVIGGFAALIATSQTDEPPPPASPVVVAPVALPTAGAVTSALDPSLDDAALARLLETASFDRDWGAVSGVADVLRARTGARPLGPAPDATERGPPSLVELDQEYRRQAFERELERRDNPATRLARDPALAPEVKEERLLVLLLAQPVRPTDEVVLADAAEHLARLGLEGGRRRLLDLLGDPLVPRADAAAEALARSGGPAGHAALAVLAKADPDPAVRARAASALGLSPGLLRGDIVPAALAAVATTDQDTAVRTHAIASLGRADLGASPVAREALAKLLADESADLRARLAAVAALRANARLARGLPADLVLALDKALDRADGPLLAAAATALGDVGGPELLPRLEGAAAAAQSLPVRAALEGAAAAIRARAIPE